MTANDLLFIGSLYIYGGMAVALIFLVYGIGLMDENAQGAWIFRPLIIPGILLIWPLVLWRWWVLARGENKLARHKMPRGAQRLGQLLFSLMIVAVIVTAVLNRQNPSNLAQPIQLEAAQ